MFDIRKAWEHAGYPCFISASPMGFLCGYVSLPLVHPVSGMSYDDIHSTYNIHVHGGLTFSRFLDLSEIGSKDLLHLAMGKQTRWVVGFDCGHAGDAPYFASPISMMFPSAARDHIWDFDEVTRETDALAEQLAALA